jgi:hypothetical protein
MNPARHGNGCAIQGSQPSGREMGSDGSYSFRCRTQPGIARLTYRHPLPEKDAWWMPTQLQLGASLWRVPDIRGQTRRFDLNATPIWRSGNSWGYVEGGIGVYLLSKTEKMPPWG